MRLAPQARRLDTTGKPALVKEFKRVVAELSKGASLTLAHAPDGFDAFVAADLARGLAAAGAEGAAALVHVARDAQRSRMFQDALAFTAPDLEILDFPAWDCQPYDRVVAERGRSSRGA